MAVSLTMENADWRRAQHDMVASSLLHEFANGIFTQDDISVILFAGLKTRREEMFTRTELEMAVQLVRSKKLLLHRPLTVQCSNDIRWEADFYFFRGAKKHYQHSAHFWLCCVTWLDESWKGFQLLMAQRYPDLPHARIQIETNALLDAYNLYETISPESFQEIIEGYSSRLKNANIPHVYHWEGQVQQAMQMSKEWNDQTFIAETESEFLVFHWETSA